jgi:hypothetical protein
VPAQATAAKARLITASSNVSAAFARLGAATSAGQHASIARSSGVQQAGEQFDADYDYLVRALRS